MALKCLNELGGGGEEADGEGNGVSRKESCAWETFKGVQREPAESFLAQVKLRINVSAPQTYSERAMRFNNLINPKTWATYRYQRDHHSVDNTLKNVFRKIDTIV